VITLIVIALTKDDAQLRGIVDNTALQAENDPLYHAIQRLWKGERDWNILSEGLHREESLLLLRVLESLEQQQRKKKSVVNSCVRLFAKLWRRRRPAVF
jgi:hypothetical protein